MPPPLQTPMLSSITSFPISAYFSNNSGFPSFLSVPTSIIYQDFCHFRLSNIFPFLAKFPPPFRHFCHSYFRLSYVSRFLERFSSFSKISVFSCFRVLQPDSHPCNTFRLLARFPPSFPSFPISVFYQDFCYFRLFSATPPFFDFFISVFKQYFGLSNNFRFFCEISFAFSSFPIFSISVCYQNFCYFHLFSSFPISVF